MNDYEKIQEFCELLNNWISLETVQELRDIFIQAEQDNSYLTTVTDVICDYCAKKNEEDR